MQSAQMHAFAAAWVANWNTRDLEAILEPFTDDAVFVSPRAAELAGTPTVSGKPALREYWASAMPKLGDTHFRLSEVLCDEVSSRMLVVYDRVCSRSVVRAAELMYFDDSGRQFYGEAMYGADITHLPGSGP